MIHITQASAAIRYYSLRLDITLRVSVFLATTYTRYSYSMYPKYIKICELLLVFTGHL